MKTARSLARRAAALGLALVTPALVARAVGVAALRLGVGEGEALAWALSALLCQGLMPAAVAAHTSRGSAAGAASPVRVELFADRVLTYYALTGVAFAASLRPLLLLPPAAALPVWPVGGAVALVLFRGYFLPGSAHLRGRRLLPFAEAAAAARRLLGRGDPGLPWAGVRVPSRFAVLHFVAVGSTGSGKTLTIRMLLGAFVGRMTPGAGRRAVVYDAKRDVVSILAGMAPAVPVRILNPFDARSTRWAIARDARSPAVCLQLAETLVRTEEGPNQFFSLAAVELVAGAMVALNLSCPGGWSLRDVILATRDREALYALLDRRPETRGALAHFAEERTLANILSTVRVRMAQLEPIAAAWDHAADEVSLDEWAVGESVLVLGNDETTRVCLDALNRAILRRAVELVLNGPEVDDWRTLFVLDEVAQAGKLDALSSLLAKGRSKGAAVVLGFQDLDGLRQVYDKGADELVGQCGTKALLRTESPGTAEWASRVVGESEQ